MKQMICIVCPIGCHLSVDDDNLPPTVSGNSCPRGIDYATQEITAPTRLLTTTVKLKNGTRPHISVKTAQPIPKPLIFEAMAEINKVVMTAPVKCGDVVIKNILNTGVDVIATADLPLQIENPCF